MAREIFKEKIEELNKIGIMKIATDIYMKPDSRGFCKSPSTPDKTRSLKLYSESNSYCDFANGRKGGDIINFAAYIMGVDNWQAMKRLCDMYGIAEETERSWEEQRRMILRQQERERKRKGRQQAFYKALYALIDDLKKQEDKYRLVLEKSEIGPFGDLWTRIQNELQLVSYKLDILTAADQHTYRRMKPDIMRGISSDRPQWVCDVLDILAEAGAFNATMAEMSEIKAQRDCELVRKPGADRGRCVVW